MTFLLNAKYAAEAPSPNYPVRGSIKNDSSPGAVDGTALDSQWKDDERAIWEILLQNAAITPSGLVDTAVASDLYDSFLFAISKDYSPLKDYPINERTLGSDGNEYKALIANGPNNLPVVDPVGDITGTWVGNGVFYAEDQKGSSSNSGTFTALAQQTRDMNTPLINTIPGLTLVANQIIITKDGVYDIEAWGMAFKVDGNKLFIRNITTPGNEIDGSSEYSGSGDNTASRAYLKGSITVVDPTTYELQHYGNVTSVNQGFGFPTASSGNEIFSGISIKQRA